MHVVDHQRASIFSKNEQGSVVSIFGLMLPVIMFAAGAGIDFSRAVDAKTRITNAADAAVLAAGRALIDGTLNDSEIQAMAGKIFSENVGTRTKFAKVNNVEIQVNRGTGAVTVDVDAEVPTTLTALAGFKSLKVPVTAASVFQAKDIEVGMALDITGSMASVPSGGGPAKIDALKTAFATFANKVMPDHTMSGQKVRVGVAPFSASINLGTYASAATGARSKDGCVTERTTADRYTDAPPTVISLYDVKADGVKDIDATEGSGSYVCPSTKLVPLSNNRQALIDEVNDFIPNGFTAGHIGVQWGWNLISDNWGSVWGGSSQPDSYSRVASGKLIKAVILMTDGIFNTAFHNGKSADQAIELCKNMKAKGVLVFAVAFDAPADAQKTLQACTTPGPDYYADASNGEELDAAFAKFANKLSELHLSK